MCTMCEKRKVKIGYILCHLCQIKKEIEEKGFKVCSLFEKNYCKTPAIPGRAKCERCHNFDVTQRLKKMHGINNIIEDNDDNSNNNFKNINRMLSTKNKIEKKKDELKKLEQYINENPNVDNKLSIMRQIYRLRKIINT